MATTTTCANVGCLILEIPGALLVEHWSARKWFARILITWGFTSALTGIVVYFTHWYRSRDRARAFSGLVVAVPFSLAIGAPLSALLLDEAPPTAAVCFFSQAATCSAAPVSASSASAPRPWRPNSRRARSALISGHPEQSAAPWHIMCSTKKT